MGVCGGYGRLLLLLRGTADTRAVASVALVVIVVAGVRVLAPLRVRVVLAQVDFVVVVRDHGLLPENK